VCDTCAPKVRKSLGVTNARWIPHHIPFKQEKIWMTTYLKKNKEKIKEIKI
jgi:D-mannonate dehydratase